MDEATWVFLDPERTFPRMSGFLHKAIPATLTQKEGKLFVNIHFQDLRIRMFDLSQETFHLGIDSLFGLREDTIEPGKYSNLNHISRLCGWEFLPAPHTMPLCHVFTTLIFLSQDRILTPHRS
jgi:hypothetical protein